MTTRVATRARCVPCIFRWPSCHGRDLQHPVTIYDSPHSSRRRRTSRVFHGYAEPETEIRSEPRKRIRCLSSCKTRHNGPLIRGWAVTGFEPGQITRPNRNDAVLRRGMSGVGGVSQPPHICNRAGTGPESIANRSRDASRARVGRESIPIHRGPRPQSPTPGAVFWLPLLPTGKPCVRLPTESRRGHEGRFGSIWGARSPHRRQVSTAATRPAETNDSIFPRHNGN